ncbi:hypothetical protein V5799_000146 [Amblyomma americanum]|uniref:Uncharacterized protein n=1 Tax=Amblyomma americanum TaxID=6943 RepID=A0AAQ4D3W3_AMBAM
MTTDSTSYRSSFDIEPFCGHGEASKMKPSEKFILFLQSGPLFQDSSGFHKLALLNRRIWSCRPELGSSACR